MLPTIRENNNNCCEELKKMKRNFHALLISSGNRNMRMANLERKIQNPLNDVQKIINMGFRPKSAKQIMKVLDKTDINRNKNTIKKYFTLAGTLRKKYKLT